MSQDRGEVITEVSHRDYGSVATIIISRPTKLNCLNTHLITQLPTSIQNVINNVSDLICIILTGAAQKSFIGGADIEEMSNFADPEEARAFITRVHLAFESIRKCPVPVLARVNGYALGAGLELAAICDAKIASRNAVFAMPEVRVGIPSVVEAALLPGLIGWGRTRRLLLLAENISSDEALQWGLVDKVVEPEMLDQGVEEWVQCLRACGRKAVRNQKELIRRWEQAGIDGAIGIGIDHFGRAFEKDAATTQSQSLGHASESEPARMMGEFLRRQRNKRATKL